MKMQSNTMKIQSNAMKMQSNNFRFFDNNKYTINLTSISRLKDLFVFYFYSSFLLFNSIELNYYLNDTTLVASEFDS